MDEKKKMGRPPASWVSKLAELHFDGQWTDAYEVADRLGLKVKTVKSFFGKLDVKPRHIVENAKSRAKFRVRELKEAAKLYIEPWM